MDVKGECPDEERVVVGLAGGCFILGSSGMVAAAGAGFLPSSLCLSYLSRVPGSVSSTQLSTVCKEHTAGCRASCSSGAWLPSRVSQGGKKVGVRLRQTDLSSAELCVKAQCVSHLLWEVEVRSGTGGLSSSTYTLS